VWLSVCSEVQIRWGVHIGAIWQIRLNDPRAAAMRCYAKLRWPLVSINCTSLRKNTIREIAHLTNNNTPHHIHEVAYRRSVVCVFVCLLDTAVSPAKTDEPIEMPFGTVDSGWHKEPCIRCGPESPQVKDKVFPYSLPSVGPGADPGVQAVSPQVT